MRHIISWGLRSRLPRLTGASVHACTHADHVQARLAIYPDPPYSMLVLWAQSTGVSVLVVAQIVATCKGDAD